MSVRKHAEWMSQIDDRILEYLHTRGPGRPSDIRYGLSEFGGDLSYPQDYVDGRLDELTDRGLLVRQDDRWEYRLTNEGLSYLRGEFDASTLSPDRSSPGAEIWKID